MSHSTWVISLTGGSLAFTVAAILHSTLMCFAVGGAFYLVLSELRAYQDSNLRLLAYVKKNSALFTLFMPAVVVVSRAGLWLSLGWSTAEPVSALLHIFLWAWAAEWVVLTVAVSAALLYHQTWERLDHRSHLTIGWIYCAGNFISLAILNNILTFTVTPGNWLQTHNFWHALFNPSALPSLVLRTLVAFALVGLFALVSATRLEPKGRRNQMIRYAARWLAPPFILMPPAGIGYLASLASSIGEMGPGELTVVLLFLALGIGAPVAIFLITLQIFSQPRRLTFQYALFVLIFGLLVTLTTEGMRDILRQTPSPAGPHSPGNAHLSGNSHPLHHTGFNNG